jgi:hypothetical protein
MYFLNVLKLIIIFHNSNEKNFWLIDFYKEREKMILLLLAMFIIADAIKCKTADLQHVFKREFNLVYTEDKCDSDGKCEPGTEANGSCKWAGYKLHPDFKPAVCDPTSAGKPNIANPRGEPINGWQYPATFICVNTAKPKKQKFSRSSGLILMFFLISLIVASLGGLVYAGYYYWLQSQPDEHDKPVEILPTRYDDVPVYDDLDQFPAPSEKKTAGDDDDQDYYEDEERSSGSGSNDDDDDDEEEPKKKQPKPAKAQPVTWTKVTSAPPEQAGATEVNF